MTAAELWKRYQRYLCRVPSLGLTLDISRMGFPDGYLDGIGPRLAARFLERGLLLRPLGNVVYFMPPYVITDDEARWALRQITEVIASSTSTSEV